ncbi:MAG: DUF3343 domain-containing protein [Ruminiclostridium sp.]|nr:DUF3343 domain-containing protein [Ruminiclostridium sp.]
MLQSRSHAFILNHRMKNEGIGCELTYMPREIMKDLCNLGVRFDERELPKALNIIRIAGLPGCRLYSETVEPHQCRYEEILY